MLVRMQYLSAEPTELSESSFSGCRRFPANMVKRLFSELVWLFLLSFSSLNTIDESSI